jgi:hypothetical protein
VPINQRKIKGGKIIRHTVQLEIIKATRATLKKALVEELATKKDHLIKQYINF